MGFRLCIVFHQAHGFGGPTHRAYGNAASNDLAVGTDIRDDPVELLSPARSQAEAGDHLVEDEESPDLAGDLA